MGKEAYTLKYAPEYYFNKYDVKKKRREHSLSVAQEMLHFAKLYNVDSEKAFVAGVFHYIARDLPAATIVEFSSKTGHLIDIYEETQPLNLHAYASRHIIEKENISLDCEVLTAVEQHTYGAPNMSLLSALLYVIDFAEPTRHFKEAKVAYKLLHENLEDALIYVVTQTWGFIADEKRLIHPRSLELYNSLVLRHKRNRPHLPE